MLKVKFVKTHPKAATPAYAKPGDNGLDLTAVEYKLVEADGVVYHDYSTGIAVEIPPGYVGLIFPGSSISKKSIIPANCVGVIDSSFRGTVTVRFKRLDPTGSELIYAVGERICQLLVMPCPTVDLVETIPQKLSTTERGPGGYGHTGTVSILQSVAMRENLGSGLADIYRVYAERH